MDNSIGLIELTSIAKGFEVADALLKGAKVEMVFNRTICPGKFMVMVAGDTAAVKSSIAAGLDIGGDTVIDDLLIPNVSPEVFPAISGTRIIETTGALGIIETFSVASVIEAADAAVKAADVKLMEIHLAMAIGGKGYVGPRGCWSTRSSFPSRERRYSGTRSRVHTLLCHEAAYQIPSTVRIREAAERLRKLSVRRHAPLATVLRQPASR
jgi:microcompartment protein CcmL/EutN